MTALRLDDLTVRRGGRIVVTDACVDFPPGTLTAVIGPNGAGKSSLLAAAAGLLAPTRGAVSLDGRRIETFTRRELARRRAYLPQNARADWPVSVERVVALGLTPSLPAFGGLPDALAARIERTLQAYDLIALRHRPVTELSGGEHARAMLARAVVGDPDLLLVDEPTAGLDPRHALDATRRLRDRAGQGRTVVMAIHDLDLALRYAGRIVAMKAGAILAAGDAAEVLDASLLAELYDLPARLTRDAHGGAVRFLG